MGGIVELEPTGDGIVLHRLSRRVRERYNDIAVMSMETMPSGASLQMVTDATCLEIDVQLTLVHFATEPALPAIFELAVDGQLIDAVATWTGATVVVEPRTGQVDFTPGGPVTVRFEGLAASTKHVEVWMPHATFVQLIELRADGPVRAPEPLPRRWVHYGSSISHCLEAVRPTGVWPVIAARRAGVDLLNLSFPGQCHVDPFAGRMIGDQPADLISVKLGINVVNSDTMRDRTFVPAVHGLLDTIREHHPTAPLVLITPITCPAVEEQPGPATLGTDGRWVALRRPPDLAAGALTLRRIRDLEADIVASRRADGDSDLHLVHGPDLFGPTDLNDLPDGLHPNADGYQRIGDRFHELAFEHGPFHG